MWGVISLVVSAVGSAASYYQQAEAAEDRNESLEEQARQRNMELLEEQTQANEQAATEKFEKRREALRKKGMIRAQGAQSAGLGNTFSRQMEEADIDEMVDLSYIEKNRRNTEAYTELGLSANQTRTENSMSDFNEGLAGLGIVTDAVGGYASASAASGESNFINQEGS